MSAPAPASTPQQQQQQQQQQVAVPKTTTTVTSGTQTSSADLEPPRPVASGEATTTSSDSAATVTAIDDNLTCLWAKCGERLTSAETLFDHICEKHIGRKSTNNLNLVCGWKGCSVTTVKRDHITSHIRVHVPLKPHKCEFCGKAFKRPQDLKKHVKTHADDSMLLRSNDPAPPVTGYRPSNKFADLHNLAANPGFDQGHHMNHPSIPFGYAAQAQAPAGYFAAQPNPGAFPVYYTVNGQTTNQAHQMNQHIAAAYETKKRGLDVLNDFFGEAKRRQIDPTSYAQVGQRLSGLSAPLLGGMMDYMPAAPSLVPVGGAGGHGGPLLPHSYALPPMPNLRTKNDLVSVDQLLEQMQDTVYESSNAAAAAGVQQPGAHYTHEAINFRQSQSPPQTSVGGSAAAYATAANNSSQSSITTPDLTPGSSAMSYHSGDSPISTTGMSPVSQHSSSAAYPSLPPVSMSYTPTSAAPVSSLGMQFESDPRRRYSGGMLQKAAQHRAAAEAMETSDESAPPTPKPSATDAATAHSSESGDSAKDRAEEAWIESIRVIEALRAFIKKRIDLKLFDQDEADVDMADSASPAKSSTSKEAADAVKPEPNASTSSSSLYPTIRADDD